MQTRQILTIALGLSLFFEACASTAPVEIGSGTDHEDSGFTSVVVFYERVLSYGRSTYRSDESSCHQAPSTQDRYSDVPEKRDAVAEDELKDVLSSNGFEVDEIEAFPAGPDATDGLTFLVPLPSAPLTNAGDILTDWIIARELLPATGRWPIATGDSFFCRYHSGNPGGAALLKAAHAIADPVAAVDAEEVYVYDMIDVEMNYGDPPVATPGYLAGEVELEAWLRRSDDFTGRDIQRRATLEILKRTAGLPQPTDHWEKWIGNDYLPTHLAFVPSSLPWSGAAHISGLESEPRRTIAIALVKHWYERYGTEHVAVFGLHDLFTVANPPTDPEEIWDVARSAFYVWREIELGSKQDGSVLSFAPKIPYLRNWAFSNYP